MSFFDPFITYLEKTIAGRFLIDIFSQPIDEILRDVSIYLGWIPVLLVVLYGIAKVWQDKRQIQWHAKQENILLAINVPRDSEQSPMAVENIFSVLSGTVKIPNFKDKWIEGQEYRIFSLEIVSIDGYIQYYIRTNVRYRNMVESAIYAQYPDAEIFEAEDYTKAVPDEMPHDDWDMTGDEYRLQKAEHFPIRTWQMFEHSMSQELKDPLGSLLEALSQLKAGEQVWIQIILIPTLDKWKEAGDAFIKETFGLKDEKKKGFFEELGGQVMAIPKELVSEVTGAEPSEEKSASAQEEMFKMFKVTEQERSVVKSVYEKISKSGFKCKIRYMYLARKEVYNRKLINDTIKGYFRQYAHLDLNAMFTVPKVGQKSDYFWHMWFYHGKQNKILQAYKARSHTKGGTPYVLNVEELATLYHFPSILIKAPMIQKTVSKRAEPPPQLRFASEEEEHSLTPASDAKTESALDFEIEGVDEEPQAGTPAKPFIEPEVETPDLPVVEAPTKPLTAEVAAQTPGAIESVIEPEVEPVSKPEPVKQAQSEGKSELPDAIRILIDPSASLDIPAGDNILDDDNTPDNLPV